MKMTLKYLLVFILISFTNALYSGYQVLETEELINIEQLNILHNISKKLDFLSTPRLYAKSRFIVSYENIEDIKLILSKGKIKFDIIVKDLQMVLEYEKNELDKLRNKETSFDNYRGPILSRYLTFDEIQQYLDEVVELYPNIASLIEIGSSFEGRPLRVLKLSNGPDKSAIFFDAGIHAREWIGPPTVLNAIGQLTENLTYYQYMLDKNDFYFLPIANPDGYEYTWSAAENRNWRKNRRINEGSLCVGVDPNRNFDIEWAGGTEGAGSPCDDTYAGLYANSENETRAISEFVANNTNIKFAVSVHSCGQYLLHPFSNTTDLPPNIAELNSTGMDAKNAIYSVRNTIYRLGSVADVLYLAYGGSVDWFYVKQNISLAFVIEISCAQPPNGYEIPPEQIQIFCDETWEAYKVFARDIPALNLQKME